MSEGGFHVHGPHEHELEHAAQHDPKGMAGQLAVITAILATVGAMFAYMGGATQANAGLLKNDAAIKKTEASNQWNYYQAKSGKQNLSELALELAPEARKAFYTDEIKRYKTEKAEIKVAAEKLDSRIEGPGTTRAPSRCTSTTAGPRPPPRCRSRSRWPRSRCSRGSAGSRSSCSVSAGSASSSASRPGCTTDHPGSPVKIADLMPPAEPALSNNARWTAINGAFGPVINDYPRFRAQKLSLLFALLASVSQLKPLHHRTKAD